MVNSESTPIREHEVPPSEDETESPKGLFTQIAELFEGGEDALEDEEESEHKSEAIRVLEAITQHEPFLQPVSIGTSLEAFHFKRIIPDDEAESETVYRQSLYYLEDTDPLTEEHHFTEAELPQALELLNKRINEALADDYQGQEITSAEWTVDRFSLKKFANVEVTLKVSYQLDTEKVSFEWKESDLSLESRRRVEQELLHKIQSTVSNL